MNFVKNFFKSVIQIDKRKGGVGIILAVLAMVTCGIFGAWARCIAYGVLFVLLGYIRLEIKSNWGKYLIFALWMAAIIVVVWAVPQAMVNAVGKTVSTFRVITLNALCILAVCGIAFLITAKPTLSVVAGTFFLIALATVNGVIYQFRGKELGYTDIFSIKTAISVAGKYNFQFSSQMVYAWLFWLLFAFLGFSIPKLTVNKKLKARLISFVTEIAFVFILWMWSSNVSIKTWNSEGTRFNGYYLNFYLGVRDSVVKKPNNYSPEIIQKMADEYADKAEIKNEQKKPNIIVIMDESYADFRIFGDLRTNTPVTPFLDSLVENTVRGYALTSVYGGNTANTEFEFLTGGSMAFLPKDSVPYQQFITRNTYTLARFLTSQGYKSVATHPYWKSGWSRDVIYPYFGFEDGFFIDAYSVDSLVRDYVGDRDMFEYITCMLDNKDKEKPLFLFSITMQNHGGYDYAGEDFEKTVELQGYAGEYPFAEQYLSLIHETDSAMEYLLTKLESYPEDTVVLFFGDHFPSVESEFYDELYGRGFDTLQDKMTRYKVPFLIWANYDIPETTVELTSVNYLSTHLLNAAGIPLSPYHSFLADAEENVPAMNALGFWSKENGDFVNYSDAGETEAYWIEGYNVLTYNQFFDKKHKNEVFFGF